MLLRTHSWVEDAAHLVELFAADLACRVAAPQDFERRKHEWLPTAKDREHVQSLMQPVYEPGKFASWVAPPKQGINRQALDYKYVMFAKRGEEPAAALKFGAQGEPR